MPDQLISKKTLRELAEHFSDEYVVRTIENTFDDADIECDEHYKPEVNGERRRLVYRYCHTLDLTDWSDVRKLLTVFETVLLKLESNIENEVGGQTYQQGYRTAFNKLTKFLRKDGFHYHSGTIATAANAPGLDHLAEVAEQIDSAYLLRQLRTMEDNIEADPGLAIGTAKELIETVCKTILDDRGVEYNKKRDNVPKLVNAACRELKLTRDDIDDAAKAAGTIKNVLSNLAAISQGLTELRNPYGTGHGKTASTKGLQARHARLAVGAASTLACFLYETAAEQNK